MLRTSRLRTRASAFLRCSLALLVAAPLSAQNVARVVAPRVGTARVVTAAPVIDGRLDEAAWRDGAALTGFVQRELHEGDQVSERTEARILTDGQALYVGVWLHDREPDGIVRGEKIRDVTLTNSDYVAIILDTYLDRQNGFVFATTPAGIEYDGQVVKEGEGGGVVQSGQSRAQAGSLGGFNVNWDGSWTVATSTDSLGWYAEFRIPFSTLRYGAGDTQSWGLNIARSIRRKGEEAFWSPIPRQFNLYRLSRAGTLEGIQVPVRRIATLTPYVLGGTTRAYTYAAGTLARSVDARNPGEWGADLKYGLTPSLTLDLTYNTDFAQVEVDEQRTNLTRFPLFFPEKRPFFLENAGVFSAGTPQGADLFFSRRIGIDSLGNPVPIRGGGRVTGRVGDVTVGLLQIFTERAGVQPGMSYSVARASRELSARSRVGAIAIQRTATNNRVDHNRTYGVDGRVGVGDAWTLDWWGAKTETPSLTGNDVAWNARTAYQTGVWNNSARFMQVGESFNPEVGFLNRRGGYRHYDVQFMRTFRKPEWPWLKSWNPHVNYRGYYGLDGFWQSGRAHIDITEIEFANGGRLGPELNIDHEGLQRPFAIASNVTLPVGSYTWPTFGLDWATDPSQRVSLSARGDVGPFYNGSRKSGNTTFTLRQASLTSSLLFDYADVQLDQGDFVRYLVGTRVAYSFTPRLFVQSLVQYNNQARVFAANARLGWLSTAGTGLFVVLNEGQVADSFFQWERPQARALLVKYTRQFGIGG